MSSSTGDIQRRLRHTEELLKSLSQLEMSFHGDTQHLLTDNTRLPRSPNSARNNSLVHNGHMLSKPSSYSLPTRDQNETLSLTIEDLSQSKATLPESYSRPTTPMSSLKDFDIQTKPSSTPNKGHGSVALPTCRDHISTPFFSTPDELRSIRAELSRALGEKAGLLEELHHTTQQLSLTQQKVETLTSDNEVFRQEFPLLREQMDKLKAQNEAHVADTRKSVERFEVSEQRVSELEQEVNQYKELLVSVKRQLRDEQDRCAHEERAHASTSHEVDEMQERLEKLQKKATDKIMQMEEAEETLHAEVKRLSEEREKLLVSVSDLEKVVHQLKLENSKLSEHKTHHDALVPELQRRLAQLTDTLSEYETLEQIKGDLESRLMATQQSLDEQREQSGVYRRQSQACRGVMAQLERLAALETEKANGDSGVASIISHNASTSFHQSFNSSGDGSFVRVNQLDVDAFTQRSTECIDAILKNIVQLVQRQKQDGEMAASLEEKTNALRGEIAQLREERTELRREAVDRDAICTSLESRLKQRDLHLADMQNMMSNKGATIDNLDKQLRQKTSTIASLESQLDEKVLERSRYTGRLKELEDDLITKEGQLARAHKETKDTQKKLSIAAATNKTINAVQAEFYEFQRQIEQLHVDVEDKSKQIDAQTKVKDEMKAKIVALGTELERALIDLKQTQEDLAKELHSREQLTEELEGCNQEAKGQITQLQDSLVACKQQIKTYTREMEQTRLEYNSQVEVKNQQIGLLQKELETLLSEFENKELQVAKLEKGVLESEKRAKKSAEHAEQLEMSDRDLRTQVKNLEKQLEKDKAMWVAQTQDLSHRLEQTTCELSSKMRLVDDLKGSLEELTTKCGTLSEEIQRVKEENEKHLTVIGDEGKRRKILEVDLRKSEAVSEQHMEHISDLEDQLHKHNSELEDQKISLAQKDTKIDHLQMELTRCVNELTEYKENLHHSRFEIRAKEQLLADIRDNFKNAQDDVTEKQREIEELQGAVTQHRAELQQRTTQVTMLGNAMQTHQRDIEVKVKLLEDQIRSANSELESKNKLVSDLEYRLSEQGRQLRESQSEVAKLKMSIDSLLHENDSKLKLLQMELDSRESELSNKGGEYQMLYHEITRVRRELQEQVTAATTLKRDLQMALDERNRLRDELDRSAAATTEQEVENKELAERLVDAQTREAKVAKDTETELVELRAELDRLSGEHENEIAKLRDAYSEAITVNEELAAQLRQNEAQITRDNQQHAIDLDSIHRHNNSLQAELLSRKTLLETVNETLVVKDAEIARLHAKISSYERGNFARFNESFHSQNESFPQPISDVNKLGNFNKNCGEHPVSESSNATCEQNPNEPKNLSVRTAGPFQQLDPQQCSNIGSSQQHPQCNGSLSHSYPHSNINSSYLQHSDLDSSVATANGNNVNSRAVTHATKRDQVRRSLTFNDSDSDVDFSATRTNPAGPVLQYNNSITSNHVQVLKNLKSNNQSNQNMPNATSFIPISANSQSNHIQMSSNSKPMKPLIYYPGSLPLYLDHRTGVNSARATNDGNLPVPEDNLFSQNQIAENSKDCRPTNKPMHIAENSRNAIEDDVNTKHLPMPAEQRQQSEFPSIDEDPVTAVQTYRSPLIYPPQIIATNGTDTLLSAHEQHTFDMDDIQRRLETNQLLQAEIDRQLFSLDAQQT